MISRREFIKFLSMTFVSLFIGAGCGGGNENETERNNINNAAGNALLKRLGIDEYQSPDVIINTLVAGTVNSSGLQNLETTYMGSGNDLYQQHTFALDFDGEPKIDENRQANFTADYNLIAPSTPEVQEYGKRGAGVVAVYGTKDTGEILYNSQGFLLEFRQRFAEFTGAKNVNFHIVYAGIKGRLDGRGAKLTLRDLGNGRVDLLPGKLGTTAQNMQTGAIDIILDITMIANAASMNGLTFEEQFEEVLANEAVNAATLNKYQTKAPVDERVSTVFGWGMALTGKLRKAVWDGKETPFIKACIDGFGASKKPVRNFIAMNIPSLKSLRQGLDATYNFFGREPLGSIPV